jgi:hypothetical protein
LREDPEVIGAWFKLVEETKAKWGVHDEDRHNFDETGFQMGVIGSMKVVTSSERCSQPNLVQPGDCEWVTVIQSICAAGSYTPVRCEVLFGIKPRAYQESVRLCRCPSLLKTTTSRTTNTYTSINHQVTSQSSFYYLTIKSLTAPTKIQWQLHQHAMLQQC